MKTLLCILLYNQQTTTATLQRFLDICAAMGSEILLKTQEGQLYVEKLTEQSAITEDLLPTPHSLSCPEDSYCQAIFTAYELIVGLTDVPVDPRKAGGWSGAPWYHLDIRLSNGGLIKVDLSVTEVYSLQFDTAGPLLRWLSNNCCAIKATDLIPLKTDVPPCIFSPIKLRADGSMFHQEKPLIIKLVAQNIMPLEVYATCKYSGEESMVELSLIEPAFEALFLSMFVKNDCSQSVITSASQASAGSTARIFPESQCLLQDTSISLQNWTPSQESRSQPTTSHDTTKAENKTMLKKLMLLSLRHVGVDKHHHEFPSIWKHLYCGSLFALRRELGTRRVSQSDMLSIIRSNMNFLNIK